MGLGGAGIEVTARISGTIRLEARLSAMIGSRAREWRCSDMPHVASVAVNGDEIAARDTSLSGFRVFDATSMLDRGNRSSQGNIPV